MTLVQLLAQAPPPVFVLPAARPGAVRFTDDGALFQEQVHRAEKAPPLSGAAPQRSDIDARNDGDRQAAPPDATPGTQPSPPAVAEAPSVSSDAPPDGPAAVQRPDSVFLSAEGLTTVFPTERPPANIAEVPIPQPASPSTGVPAPVHAGVTVLSRLAAGLVLPQVTPWPAPPAPPAAGPAPSGGPPVPSIPFEGSVPPSPVPPAETAVEVVSAVGPHRPPAFRPTEETAVTPTQPAETTPRAKGAAEADRPEQTPRVEDPPAPPTEAVRRAVPTALELPGPHESQIRNESGPSPAGEVARLLLPEARLGGLLERLASDAPRPADSEPSPSQAATWPVHQSGEAGLRSARVIDAHESFSLRSAVAVDDPTASSPVDRLVRVLSSSAGPRGSYLKLQLEPPSLGQLRLEVRMNQEALSIRLQAETVAVKNLLSERIAELKTTLQGHGLQVERVTVELKPPTPEWRGAESDGQHRHPTGQGNPAPHEQSDGHGQWGGHAFGQDEAANRGESNRLAADGREEGAEGVTAESSVDVLI